MNHNIMLDLETLGTKPGCRILSIGATEFNLNGRHDNYFHYAVDHTTQELLDAPDVDTMLWWGKQSDEAKNAAFHVKDAVSVLEALTNFSTWLRNIKESPQDRLVIWGNGATFDEPIIAEAMRRYDVKIPWTFRDSMCFRTLKEIGAQLGVMAPVFEGVKHSSLADAINQAEWADMILARMAFPPKENEKHI